ncbi:MAG: hypothetical protein IJ542_02630 [Clostridia bacterium]|nr:hypothetical protein [Clostridia bacterium]
MIIPPEELNKEYYYHAYTEDEQDYYEPLIDAPVQIFGEYCNHYAWVSMYNVHYTKTQHKNKMIEIFKSLKNYNDIPKEKKESIEKWICEHASENDDVQTEDVFF